MRYSLSFIRVLQGIDYHSRKSTALTVLQQALTTTLPILFAYTFFSLVYHSPFFLHTNIAPPPALRKMVYFLTIASYGLYALSLLFSIVYYFSDRVLRSYHSFTSQQQILFPALLALACYSIISMSQSVNFLTLPVNNYTLFTALWVAFGVSYLYFSLYQLFFVVYNRFFIHKKLSIKIDFILASWASVIVLGLFSCIRFFSSYINLTPISFFYQYIISHIVSVNDNPLWALIKLMPIDALGALIGFTDNSFLLPIKKYPQIFTLLHGFVYMGGSGATMGLIIALFFKSKVSKTLTLALVPSAFSFSQFAIFAFAIVSTPSLLIPFFISPFINLFVTWIAIKINFISIISTQMPLFPLPFISGYAITGSINGAILQTITILISILCYYPFILFNDEFAILQFRKSEMALINFSVDCYVVEDFYLTRRNDHLGIIARLLVNELQNAINTQGLEMVYQPKVNYSKRRVIGAEALLRWKHLQYGNISPNLIIILAQEGNLSQSLTYWIMNQVASRLSHWQNLGLNDVSIAVNLSAWEIGIPHIAQYIKNLLDIHRVDPVTFEIEIVENMALSHSSTVRKNMDSLHNIGIKINIDDFGVGHSSAIYLRRFPIYALKIDKILTEDIVDDLRSQIIVRNMIQMCKDLGTYVVAEFVEDLESVEKLHSFGCCIFQGFYFAPPLRADAVLKYIQNNRQNGSIIYTLPLDSIVPR